MKVVFTKDLPGIAKKGQIKDVQDGYGKNFLIAKGFAVMATQAIVSKIQNEAKQKEISEKKNTERMQVLRNDLNKRTFTVSVKVGDKKQIFGSVNEKDVLVKIKEKVNIDLDKSQLVLPKHMKELGEYEFEIKLGGGLSAHPKLNLIEN
jgi:large subunit ribosomal protein L9